MPSENNCKVQPLTPRPYIKGGPNNFALVTELAYVSDSKPEFCGFDSHQGHQIIHREAAGVATSPSNWREGIETPTVYQVLSFGSSTVEHTTDNRKTIVRLYLEGPIIGPWVCWVDTTLSLWISDGFDSHTGRQF